MLGNNDKNIKDALDSSLMDSCPKSNNSGDQAMLTSSFEPSNKHLLCNDPYFDTPQNFSRSKITKIILGIVLAAIVLLGGILFYIYVA